jgi:hypothetical protein
MHTSRVGLSASSSCCDALRQDHPRRSTRVVETYKRSSRCNRRSGGRRVCAAALTTHACVRTAAATAAWVVMCSVRSPHADNGLMTVRRLPMPPSASGGGDAREVVLDWPTNRMQCTSPPNEGSWEVREACGMSGTLTHAKAAVEDVRACAPCPCEPDYRLPGGSDRGPDTSDYAVVMCHRIVKEHGCGFRRGIVVGLGTGCVTSALQTRAM